MVSEIVERLRDGPETASVHAVFDCHENDRACSASESREIMAERDAVLALMAGAADEIERLRSALADVLDDEQCTLDHDGGCQTHGAFGGPCPVAAARGVLAAGALAQEVDDG